MHRVMRVPIPNHHPDIIVTRPCRLLCTTACHVYVRIRTFIAGACSAPPPIYPHPCRPAAVHVRFNVLQYITRFWTVCTYRGRGAGVVGTGTGVGGVARYCDGVVEAVLVHDPVGLVAVGGAALVEDERLAHADAAGPGGGVDGLVPAGGLPEPGGGGAVGARARRVLLVLVAEQVPVVLRAGADPAPLCTRVFMAMADPSISSTSIHEYCATRLMI